MSHVANAQCKQESQVANAQGKQKSWFLDADLKELEEEVCLGCERDYPAEEQQSDFDTEKLSAVVAHLRDVAQTEFDRETNLNTRAAAVAGVAGLIVTASGAVGKSIFTPPHSTTVPSGTVAEGTAAQSVTVAEATVPLETVAIFLGGLVFIVAALLMVVLGVLKPKQAPGRRMFFTDTLVALWNDANGPREVLLAEPKQLDLLLVDRQLRTIALWSVRNRLKARWLRRGWLFLAFGVLLIGAAGMWVVSTVTKTPLPEVVGIVGGAFVVVVVLLLWDPFKIGRPRPYPPEELETVAARLSPEPVNRPRGFGQPGDDPS